MLIPYLYGFLLSFAPSAAFAHTSLGISVQEDAPMTHKFFSGFFLYIQQFEQAFSHRLTEEFLQIQQHNSLGVWLIVIAFLYGILHASGPGHGKAIISSYVLSEGASPTRGLLLTLIASLSQSISAILIMSVVYLLLPIRWTVAAHAITVFSFVLVSILGLSLFIRTTLRLYKILKDPNNKTLSPNCACASHQMLEEKLPPHFTWRTALLMAASIGLRPCSGALLLMSFALLNGLYVIGVLAILAMGVGAFVTVSLCVLFAVKIRSFANTFLSQSKTKKVFFLMIEWLASLAILAMGISLTLASGFEP